MSRISKNKPDDSAHSDELPPLIISDMTPPIEGDTTFDGALGLRHVEHDLEVILLRPDGAVPGTEIELYWNNAFTPVVSLNVQEQHANNRFFPLMVPAETIRPDFADVYCIVRRPSSNPTPTKALKLRVKLTRPGGDDPDRDTEGHQGLVFFLPPDLEAGSHVDLARASQGIVIEVQPYENMAEWDCVIFSWGTEVFTHFVTAEEVRRSFEITIDEAVIREAGDDERLAVAMQVMDVAGNYSAPNTNAAWSPIQRVYVNLGLLRMYAPFLEQAGEIVDLHLLEDDPQKVLIFADPNFFEVNDRVQFHWEGRDRQNFPINFSGEQRVNQINVLIEFDVPNDILKALAGGIARMSYQLYKTRTDEWFPSKKLRVRVNGEYIEWPAPSVPQAHQDGFLNPDLDSATVVFSVRPGWSSGHWIKITWLATSSDGTVDVSQERQIGEIPDDGQLVFEVPGPDIRKFDGLITRVYYEWRDTQSRPTFIQKSLPLFLRVGELVTGLEEPIIDQAKGDWLNAAEIPIEGITGEIPFIETQPGDVLTLYWRGETEEVSTQIEFPIDESNEGLVTTFALTRDFVLASLDTDVRVSYRLSRPGTPTRFSNNLRLTIEEREPILFEDFDDLSRRLIGPGQYFDLRSMRVRNLSGPVEAGITTTFIYGSSNRPGLYVPPALTFSHYKHSRLNPQTVRIEFKFLYTYVRFGYTWAQFPSEIHFYNKDVRLHSEYFPEIFIGHYVHVEFSAPADEFITAVEFVTTDICFADFFTFRL